MMLRPDRHPVPDRYPNRRRVPKTSTRRGNVLILFAMMLFGLMALAALVIDLGFARLAQRQMQSAVDSAAIEGLRFRDEFPPGFEDSEDETPENMETARRQHVQTWVGWRFDDDLLANSEDEYNFGAGPILEFTEGPGDADLFASQKMPSAEELMSAPEPPVYKPIGENALQLNLENRPEGDMVAGTPLEAWSIGDGNDAFLVRMRRTNDPDGLDRQEDVSSAGPPLPYLFARGSLMNRGSIGRGITARATAIADLRPVVRIGVANPDLGLPGTLGLTVAIDDWDTATADDSLPASPTGARTIGEPISIAVEDPAPPGDGYVALHQAIDGVDHVVGFGLATSDSDGNVTKRARTDSSSLIANENASAVFGIRPANNDIPLPDPSILGAVIAANRSLQGRPDILHAPVSVR